MSRAESCRTADSPSDAGTDPAYAGRWSGVPQRSSATGSRLLALALYAALIVGFSGGCSMYRFGNCTLHTPDVRSVHVQMFENDTYRRGLGPWLTESVAKEIQLRTPYKIADARTADSFLRATWVADRKSVLVESANDDVRDVGYTGRIEVTWTNRSGVPLTEGRIIKITEDVSFVPEGGQSITTAQQQMVRNVAQQIVNQMEAPW